MRLVAFLMLVAVASVATAATAGAASADDLFTKDVGSGCSCTINSARTDISWTNFIGSTGAAWFVEDRILTLNGNDSVQSGIAMLSHTGIVDGCNTQTATVTDYWRWTGSTDNCGYTNDSTGGDFYVERTTSTSSKWDMLIHGSIVATSSTLFGAPTDMYAGGKVNRVDLGNPESCVIFGDAAEGDPLQRSAQAFDQTKTWTTVQSAMTINDDPWSSGGKLVVGNTLPNAFDINYDQHPSFCPF